MPLYLIDFRVEHYVIFNFYCGNERHPHIEIISEIFVTYFFEIGSSYAAQAGLQLKIFLPQPPKCWCYRPVPPFPAQLWFLMKLVTSVHLQRISKVIFKN
jgi:hypothetical protein